MKPHYNFTFWSYRLLSNRTNSFVIIWQYLAKTNHCKRSQQYMPQEHFLNVLQLKQTQSAMDQQVDPHLLAV